MALKFFNQAKNITVQLIQRQKNGIDIRGGGRTKNCIDIKGGGGGENQKGKS